LKIEIRGQFVNFKKI